MVSNEQVAIGRVRNVFPFFTLTDRISVCECLTTTLLLLQTQRFLRNIRMCSTPTGNSVRRDAWSINGDLSAYFLACMSVKPTTSNKAIFTWTACCVKCMHSGMNLVPFASPSPKHLKQNINIPLLVVVVVTTEVVLIESVEVEEGGCWTLSAQSGTLRGWSQTPIAGLNMVLSLHAIVCSCPLAHCRRFSTKYVNGAPIPSQYFSPQIPIRVKDESGKNEAKLQLRHNAVSQNYPKV